MGIQCQDSDHGLDSDHDHDHDLDQAAVHAHDLDQDIDFGPTLDPMTSSMVDSDLGCFIGVRVMDNYGKCVPDSPNIMFA